MARVSPSSCPAHSSVLELQRDCSRIRRRSPPRACSSSMTKPASSRRCASCSRTRASYRITALGGKPGLERLPETASPDIVLTDVRMPDVSGVEVLGAARQRRPRVPVILMTAQATLQTAMQAVNEGAFYYIQKPFRNDELLAILRRAAEHRKLRVENSHAEAGDPPSRAQHVRRRPDRHAAALAGGAAARRDGGARPTPRCSSPASRARARKSIARYIHDLSPRADTVLPVDQLRRAAGVAARERTVRPREGLVHRGGEGQDGPVRRRATGARSSSTKSARRRRRRR